MLQRRRRCGGAWRRLGRKGDLQASYKVLNCETRIWIRHFHDFCDHSCELQPRCRQNLLISWRETVSSRAVSSKDVWQFILRCPVDEAKSTFKMKGLVISLFSLLYRPKVPSRLIYEFLLISKWPLILPLKSETRRTLLKFLLHTQGEKNQFPSLLMDVLCLSPFYPIPTHVSRGEWLRFITYQLSPLVGIIWGNLLCCSAIR